ncbi:MAG: endonuclease/exonuclease/phosphatase family protein [Woeseiaceae bacterium]|nr:endonuclease/exonuclease/phosphatase family protein [Woeseiaceae bacterium]
MARRPELKIATFNLYNLQLPGVAMYHGNTYSQKHYDSKITWTADMLKRIDADIIGFQELWSPQALKDAFEAAGLENDYRIGAKLFPNSIATAVAVKKPHELVSRTWTKDFPKELVLKKRKSSGTSGVPDYKMSISADYFSRAILKARIKPRQGNHPAPEILFYVAHLKSKLPIRLDKEESRKPSVKMHSTAIGSALATIRRTAEAAALRVMLTKAMKGNNVPVVVVGDLNDTEHSVSNTIITADPSYRLMVSSRRGSKSDVGLYSASSLQEYRSLRDVNYTHYFNGRHETLDHILVSEQFYDYSKRRKWSFKEMSVYNDFIDDEDKASSDHGVVAATFKYHPA